MCWITLFLQSFCISLPCSLSRVCVIFSLIGGNYLNAKHLNCLSRLCVKEQHEYFITHFIPLLAGGHSRFTHIPRMRSWISLAVGTIRQTDICSLWVTRFIHSPSLTFPIHTLNLTLAQRKFPWRDFGKHTATQLLCSSTKTSSTHAVWYQTFCVSQ